MRPGATDRRTGEGVVQRPPARLEVGPDRRDLCLSDRLDARVLLSVYYPVRKFCFLVHWNANKRGAALWLVVKRDDGDTEDNVPAALIKGEGVRVVAIGKQAGIHFFFGTGVLFCRARGSRGWRTPHTARRRPFSPPKITIYVGIAARVYSGRTHQQPAFVHKYKAEVFKGPRW